MAMIPGNPCERVAVFYKINFSIYNNIPDQVAEQTSLLQLAYPRAHMRCAPGTFYHSKYELLCGMDKPDFVNLLLLPKLCLPDYTWAYSDDRLLHIG